MAQEIQVIEQQIEGHPIDVLGAAVDAKDVMVLQDAVQRVYVDQLVKQYVVSLTDATRKHETIHLGASPRGSLGLFRAAQAYALLDGRDYVLPDDVKCLAVPVLAHRVILNPTARMRSVSGESIIENVLERVPVPGARPRERSTL